MDFNDTPEEAAFRKECFDWLSANAELLGPDDVASSTLGERTDPESIAAAKAWQKKKADGGWACITWPKELGGRGATPIQSMIWAQEEARFQTPPNIFGIGIGMCGPTILTHGTDEQKAQWIPKLVSGEEVWCQLFSEPSAGSDLAGLRSTAVREGDDWIINGQKIWTTGAQFCDWGILVVRHDTSVAKHAGLTFFVVDMHSPGIEIRPINQINGGQGFNEVFFTDVRIPDANRISEIGNGWAVSITTLMNERMSIGSSGGESRIYDLLSLAKQLEIDGRPAIQDEGVKQRLADFYVKSKGIEHTGSRMKTTLSQGGTPGPEASLGKLVGAAMMQEMAAYAMELQGAAGVLLSGEDAAHEGSWPNLLLGIPGLRVAGGTDEVLRNIISERVLGLPPEVRLDKGVAFKDVPTGPPS